jgi:L-ascorbate metabolism protein UlaG (beta-lactamase superfamily)
MPSHDEMQVRRLGWAGLEVTAAGRSLVVDLLEDMSPLAAFVGEARGPLPPPSQDEVAGALLTHLHADHTDAPAVARVLDPDGIVLRPQRACGEGLETIATLHAENGLAETGVATRVLEPWETTDLEPFTVTAVPAVDGFGDPQISWVIEAGNRRIFHGGDTVFHGSWWLIAMRFGPFDAAFLPANGAVCDFPHRQPASPLVCTMDPVQAAAAASLLNADLAIPIHYDTIHGPPVYIQVDRPAEAFTVAAAERGVAARVLEPGETLTWPV